MIGKEAVGQEVRERKRKKRRGIRGEKLERERNEKRGQVVEHVLSCPGLRIE